MNESSCACNFGVPGESALRLYTVGGQFPPLHDKRGIFFSFAILSFDSPLDHISGSFHTCKHGWRKQRRYRDYIQVPLYHVYLPLSGGKVKPLKSAKKDKKELDEDDLAHQEKLRAGIYTL